MKKIYLISILFPLITISKSFCQSKIDMTEQLINNTIKIECAEKNMIKTGTGFFFNFQKDTLQCPVIITNKHVVEGSNDIKLFFKKSKDNKPQYEAPYIIPIDSSLIISHPNKNIDLVAINISPILNYFYSKNIDLYIKASDESIILNDSLQKQKLNSIENVIMIGYPNGLWDQKNNLPIVRNGITATSPFIDYNGKREFLIDIAAFGGSSGSPVYIYNSDPYIDKESNRLVITKNRFFLLGIMYSGPIYSIDGKVVKTSPNEPDINVKSGIPMNLGFVIKATEILEFKKVIFK
ncbi:serine protease [Flavobacterium sp. ST-75]|uniref:Serine protease n=1 Tax=Flavobacterium rhizophilum TaxID=3163296 RepID=A0ABW8YCG4_9FLAO